MKLSERRRTVMVLALFAVVFLGLCAGSFTQKSATWDEPQHLTAGYAALARGDFRVDAEHPPLARAWAALPLAVSSGVKFDAANPFWQHGPPWFFCHDFLYRNNDADALLYRARFMIALLGVLLGVILFFWARDLFGFWPATATLALYCFEPNILAHAGLVTTDFALVCFAFGALYFLWRLTRQWTALNLAGLTIFFVLAQISKFSAILLWPVVALLLFVRWEKPLRALGVVALLGVATYAGIWTAYGFRFRPTPEPSERFAFEFHKNPRIQSAAPLLSKATGWTVERRLLPAGYAEGFLLGQAKAKERPGYLLGQHNRTGWWYYFPVAILVKTPITVLVLAMTGIVAGCARLRDGVFAFVPIAVFLGAAMLSHINIGLRHVLTIYPFALLLAGGALTMMPRWLATVAPVLAAAELALVWPDCIASFNLAAGGPKHGDEFLVDSNLDWGQDLKRLKRWMDRNGVSHINLSYFGTADPGYYGIECTCLPGSPFYAEKLVAPPRLPGYVAVSVTNLRNMDCYESLREREPLAVIGHSIRVYRLDRF